MEKNNGELFVGHFMTDIQYKNYKTESFDQIHNTILSLELFKNMLYERDEVNMYPMIKGLSRQKDFSTSREITYLFFQAIYCEQPLYINGGSVTGLFEYKENYIGAGGQIEICDINYIQTIMEENVMEGMGRDFFLMKYLAHIKYFAENHYKIHTLLPQKTVKKKIGDYSIFFQDLGNIPNITEEFKNCTINIKYKGGKPFTMEATTQSPNIDFSFRKNTLGSHRKVEANVSHNKVKSVRVTKKYKYGNQ